MKIYLGLEIAILEDLAKFHRTTLSQDKFKSERGSMYQLSVKGLDRGACLNYTEINMWKKWQKPNKKRIKRILEYRQRGFSYRQIGGIFHLSHTRIKQLIDTANKERT